MTAQEFAYYLQGFVEIVGTQPTAGQWEIIKKRLLEKDPPNGLLPFNGINIC